MSDGNKKRCNDCLVDKTKLKEVYEAMFGNGKKGLKYDYIEHKTRVDTVMKTIEDKMKTQTRVFWVQFTSCMTAIVVLIVALVAKG